MAAHLAVAGGHPVRTTPFPEWPVFGEEERAALLRVLESRRWWMGDGDEVRQFEQEFAEFHATRHALAVTNGTHTLELILMALGVGYGDEVIIPDYTFIATATSVLFVNAIPIPVDVEADTLCLDPAGVEQALTPRTRAIITVHLAGNPGRLDRLQEVARRHGIPLIEDAAHAHGARWKGVPVGNHGVAASFSFQASKTMTAGEGGAIVTNDAQLADAMASMRNCGRIPGKPFYRHEILGSNYRMTEFQAAVLRVQLRRLKEAGPRRHANGVHLARLLAQIPGIQPQHQQPDLTQQGHYLFIFRYAPDAFGGLSRDELIRALEAEGIPTQESYPAIHATPLFTERRFGPRFGRPSQPLYRELPDYGAMSFPVAEQAAERVVWLPHRVLLGQRQDMEQVAEAIEKIRRHPDEARRRSAG